MEMSFVKQMKKGVVLPAAFLGVWRQEAEYRRKRLWGEQAPQVLFLVAWKTGTLFFSIHEYLWHVHSPEKNIEHEAT